MTVRSKPGPSLAVVPRTRDSPRDNKLNYLLRFPRRQRRMRACRNRKSRAQTQSGRGVQTIAGCGGLGSFSFFLLSRDLGF